MVIPMNISFFLQTTFLALGPSLSLTCTVESPLNAGGFGKQMAATLHRNSIGSR